MDQPYFIIVKTISFSFIKMSSIHFGLSRTSESQVYACKKLVILPTTGMYYSQKGIYLRAGSGRVSNRTSDIGNFSLFDFTFYFIKDII
jgi:hypothetical protein